MKDHILLVLIHPNGTKEPVAEFLADPQCQFTFINLSKPQPQQSDSPSLEEEKPKRGRPKGSKNRPKTVESKEDTE